MGEVLMYWIIPRVQPHLSPHLSGSTFHLTPISFCSFNHSAFRRSNSSTLCPLSSTYCARASSNVSGREWTYVRLSALITCTQHNKTGELQSESTTQRHAYLHAIHCLPSKRVQSDVVHGALVAIAALQRCPPTLRNPIRRCRCVLRPPA